MSHYQTRQKRMLLQYLESNCEHAFTVDELSVCMQNDLLTKSVPGKSTIYRMMPMLVNEGLVKRFVKGNSRQFLYQMVCGENCNCHLHLKCSACGKLFHMEDQESKDILQRVLKKHRFAVDKESTVLFGFCENCK